MKVELGLKIRSAVSEQSDLGCGGGLVVAQTVEQVARGVRLASFGWDYLLICLGWLTVRRGLYYRVGSGGGNVCVGRVFIMEGNNDVVVISENNPMKTNVKQKKSD